MKQKALNERLKEGIAGKHLKNCPCWNCKIIDRICKQFADELRKEGKAVLNYNDDIAMTLKEIADRMITE